MLFIHPPLAVLGYVFIFLFTLTVFRAGASKKRLVNFLGLATWSFTLLGLVTGMIWAQVAWGSYWSWDPKETLTLLLFGTLSAVLVSWFERNLRLSKWLALLSCVLSVLTGLSSFIIVGLHSFI
jgi:ABC-type transport system involved in cytochrome c biogenesis permease subunit